MGGPFIVTQEKCYDLEDVGGSPSYPDEACRDNIQNLSKTQVSVTSYMSPSFRFSVYKKPAAKRVCSSNQTEHNKKFCYV
jgi:hypothetical protein